MPARPSDVAHPHTRGFVSAAVPQGAAPVTEQPLRASSQQHPAWAYSPAAAASSQPFANPAAAASYLQPQPSSVAAAGVPYLAQQSLEVQATGYGQPQPDPSVAIPNAGYTASYLLPPVSGAVGGASGNPSGHSQQPGAADGYWDRLTGQRPGSMAVPADEYSDEVPTSASATGSRPLSLAPLPRASTDALPGAQAAAGMTIHAEVSLPAGAAAAGMTIHAAVSVPPQQAAVGLPGDGSSTATGDQATTADPRPSWDVAALQRRSVLDAYAPFTAEQLTMHAEGLLSGAGSAGGALKLFDDHWPHLFHLL